MKQHSDSSEPRKQEVYPRLDQKKARAKEYELAMLWLTNFGLMHKTHRGVAEIDFVIDSDTDVIPVEVNAELNLRAKILKVHRNQF